MNYLEKQCPTLAAYAERVGAKMLNFRRFMISEDVGPYYVEKTVIRIDEAGLVSCRDAHVLPTEQEQEAIKREVLAAGWPKSVLASEAQFRKLQTKCGKSSKLYPLYCRKSGNIKMVQERKQTKEGKAFIPWSMWSDGEWRPMEPDGQLPFYKPRKRESNFIMVHEGTKAAEAAANVPKSHPWYAELKKYEHWGMIGGALAPHRSDYSELEEAKPVEVVYFADNDQPGKAVAGKFSEHWGKKLKVVFLGINFPHAWDIADPMPEGLFKEKEYIGPELYECMIPATRATIRVPILNDEGQPSGKTKVVLNEAFIEEWWWTTTNGEFVNIDFPSNTYSEEEFNRYVSPFSDVRNTAALLQRRLERRADCWTYDPSKETGYLDKENTFNVYQKAQTREKAGDKSQWIAFTDHLFPDKEDRAHALKWIATLIARPDIRMTYSMLLISEVQGVGKTTLAERILAPLVGKRNCSTPSETEIVESQFNDWAYFKRLIIVSEIYAGNSWKAYNKLKALITDKDIRVNKKFAVPVSVQNWCHILASSNSRKALRVDNDDRRWLVPEVTEEKKPHKFWKELHAWLEKDGLGIIKAWAIEYVEKHGAVQAGEHAPMTKSKQEVIDEGLSIVTKRALELLEDLEEVDGKVFTTDRLLYDAALISLKAEGVKLEDRGGRPLGELCRAVRKKGFYASEIKGSQKKSKVPGMPGTLVDVYHRPIGKHERLKRSTLSNVLEEGYKLLDLKEKF